MTSLPSEIGQLTNLTTLDLDRNGLASLPPEIGQLTNLTTLFVQRNELTALPSELAGPLRSGLMLHVADNPLDEPLPELIERGPDALAAYLASLEDAEELFEAKLLLVGEGNVGKTCLVAALRGEPFVADRPTTHGIEVRDLTLPHPTRPDVDLTVRTWDFGGQEVYRITHQFFFSPRALYLVVWKSREGQEQNEVEGWLRRIRLRVGTTAQALIVATHCTERYPQLAYAQLQQAVPDLIRGRYDVDSRSDTGMKELREAIGACIAALPQMGQRISRRWTAVRDELLARAASEPQIPYDDYLDACARHNVTGRETDTLINLLHDLGQVIYYGSDEGLRDVIVLNPEWLTKAVSYVLEDRPTRDADGVLDHKRLRQIWAERPDGDQYPSGYHPYFLRLMEKFDVSYRLADDPDRSLIAQLVPEDPPELPWDHTTAVPEGIRTITLICKFSEPALGIMAWLTVRHHAASTGRHWTTGVFLRHPVDAYASEALLRLGSDGQLTVQVRAPSPDLFFNVLRDSVEHLARSRWRGLTYRLYVPCPTVPCDGQFPLDGLLGYRERGGERQNCLSCQADHDISGLLTGFAAPAAPTLQPEIRQLQAEINTVAAGVERIGRYAADTAAQVRRVVKAVGTEVTDCPRLFTIATARASGIKRFRIFTEHYRLTLWCEHPGHWHACDGGDYDLHPPKGWFATIAPYANLVVLTLQLVVPIAGGVAGVALSKEQLEAASGRIELMKTLVEKLPSQLPTEQIEATDANQQLTPAEGAALRAFRAMLFQLDDQRQFGGLRRAQAPSGEYLWICPTHYEDYDPGLPALPQ